MKDSVVIGAAGSLWIIASFTAPNLFFVIVWLAMATFHFIFAAIFYFYFE